MKSCLEPRGFILDWESPQKANENITLKISAPINDQSLDRVNHIRKTQARDLAEFDIKCARNALGKVFKPDELDTEIRRANSAAKEPKKYEHEMKLRGSYLGDAPKAAPEPKVNVVGVTYGPLAAKTSRIID